MLGEEAVNSGQETVNSRKRPLRTLMDDAFDSMNCAAASLQSPRNLTAIAIKILSRSAAAFDSPGCKPRGMQRDGVGALQGRIWSWNLLLRFARRDTRHPTHEPPVPGSMHDIAFTHGSRHGLSKAAASQL
jgi:hypothetical protein